VIAHRACLTRQVPALSEPCEGANSTTAYSRVFETVELLLVPGPAPTPAPAVNHSLRLLFGLDAAHTQEDGTIDPVDQAILDARAQILVLPQEQQADSWLALFRQLAAADEIDMAPASDPDTGAVVLFPALDRAPLLLAEIRDIVLTKTGTEWTTTGGVVHNEVRSAHVPTRTIQELLVGHLLAHPQLLDAGGPRIDRGSVTINDDEITFTVSKDLHAASVQPSAFAVSAFDATSGWQTATIDTAAYDAASKTVTLTLSAALGGDVQRVIALGTGATPLLDADFLPLAGALSDPPASADHGRDFVYMRHIG